MDGAYDLQSTTDYSDKALLSPENLILPSEYQSLMAYDNYSIRIPTYWNDELSAISQATSITPENQRGEDVDTTLIKAKIVGAPPEIASLLDEIQRENELYQQDAASTFLGADPELDEFMETYCDVLVKYKSDLERPLDEATTFLNKVEMQFRNLCSTASARSLSDDGAQSSDGEDSGGDLEANEAQPSSSEDRALKDRLLRRFGSHIGTLKLEFSKKKKKGKLPKEARQILLEWWNLHYKWPYPTEADKIALAESTGLDQKQINNWFINQRKRHWKPSENMQFGVMDNLSGQFLSDD